MYSMAPSTSSLPSGPHYFTEFTLSKALLYLVAILYVASVAFVSILEPFLNLECPDPGKSLKFGNPAYDGSNCPLIRHAALLFLSKEECAFARRLVASVLFGGLIGKKSYLGMETTGCVR